LTGHLQWIIRGHRPPVHAGVRQSCSATFHVPPALHSSFFRSLCQMFFGCSFSRDYTVSLTLIWQCCCWHCTALAEQPYSRPFCPNGCTFVRKIFYHAWRGTDLPTSMKLGT